MPWNGSGPRIYEMASIMRHTPTTSGSTRCSRWVGGSTWESRAACGRPVAPVLRGNPCLSGHDPTHFMYELVPDADRVARREN